MDRIKQMQLFVRVAERRSFTAAAKDLMLPRATVTNQIKMLEQRLAVRLLARTTRQVTMTEEGEMFYERALSVLSEVDEAEHLFSLRSPKGLLRVNLQGTLASHFVMPRLSEFTAQYPQVRIHLGEDDRYIDMIKEGVDCVLRAGPLSDSALVAKRIATMDMVTVASPGYLAQYGTPQGFADLAAHYTVGYALDASAQPSTLEFSDGGEVNSITLPSLVTVSSAQLYTDAALGGLGIIQVPRYRLAAALQQGRLVELFAHQPPPPMPVSVLYPQRRYLSARARVFIDWLVGCFNEPQSER